MTSVTFEVVLVLVGVAIGWVASTMTNEFSWKMLLKRTQETLRIQDETREHKRLVDEKLSIIEDLRVQLERSTSRSDQQVVELDLLIAEARELRESREQAGQDDPKR